MLKVTIGQWADKGRKPSQQDFHGATVPASAALVSKGVALAVADGISSSDVSHEASQFAVGGFLTDYYWTSDAWSVKTSVERVVTATNSWLHAQTQRSAHRHDMDRGYVCTFSALVLKSRTAHVFHVGDTRVQRLAGGSLEPITTDHRTPIGGGESYLARALGMASRVDIDYHAMSVEPGDVFLLTTDGVHEHVDGKVVARALEVYPDSLDDAAREIGEEALRRGSTDNLTAVLLRIEQLPTPLAEEAVQQPRLPLPPLLEPRMAFEGYTIQRELHASHRSHIHLASDEATGEKVVIKTPSIDLRHDADYLERFMLEEWVARRIEHPHVLKARPPQRQRQHLYVVNEYVEGQTLAQWMRDHPKPRLESVRLIVEQIAQGLRAFHRLEMLHQDLRPENVMIDAHGTVKIIDFGSVRVAGLEERSLPGEDDHAILGTLQYTAPEYFLGEGGTPRSDLFSLGVLAYQMLSGRLPYGAGVPRARSRSAQARLVYHPVVEADRELPAWLDTVLHRAVHPDPARRYQAFSEFIHDLRHPRRDLLEGRHPALVERNPVRFWQVLSLVLGLAVLVLLRLLLARH